MPIRKSDLGLCTMRRMYNLSCKNCMNHPEQCAKFKAAHGGLTPAEYRDKLIKENKITSKEY